MNNKCVMEPGVRFLGVVELLIDWLTAPVFFLLSLRPTRPLPTIKNNLLKLSATQLAKKIRDEEVTCEQVVRTFVLRCKEVYRFVNAVVEERYNAAIVEAYNVDQFILSKVKTKQQLETETPFLGVPFTVKESCGLQGLSQSVGCKPREGQKAEKDGAAVANIRRAGGIPLAVTNTPELCLCWESSNLITGTTMNPYDQHRTAGGSSGGEGALISSGGSVIGVGSDIAGSIRIPAMFNGVFGHKPTPGYVSIAGHYPMAEDKNFGNFLVVGPMARYAEDLKPLLKVMAGEKAAELRLDAEVDLKDIRVFFMEEAGHSLVLIPVESEIKSALHGAILHFTSNYGCTIKKLNFQEMLDTVDISAAVFFGMDDIPDLLSFTSGDPKQQKSLFIELMKSVFGWSEYSQNALIFTLLQKTNCLIPRYKYNEYNSKNSALRNKFTELLGEDGVFLYPTYPIAAYYHKQFMMKTSGVMYTMIFNTLGMPSTHVPLGLNKKGLPIGIQVVAAPGHDRLCLAVAMELEAAFGGWVPPTI